MNKKQSLVMVFALLALVSACGKKNETQNSQSSSSNPYGNPYNIPYSGQPYDGAPLNSWDDFRNRVAAGNFAVKRTPTEIYYFRKYSGNSTSSKSCLWIFTCYSTSNGSYSSFTREDRSNGVIVNGLCGNDSGTTSCTPERIRNELINLVSSAYPGQVQKISASSYAFMTNSNLIYYIDLAMPIAANPVKRQDYNSGAEYQFQTQSSY